MGILRIVLDSWQDLASKTTQPDSHPGDALTGRVLCEASVIGSVLDPDGGYHQRISKSVPNVVAPWQFDLLDPTDCQPADWGWTITLSTPANYQNAVSVVCFLVSIVGVRERCDRNERSQHSDQRCLLCIRLGECCRIVSQRRPRVRP